jgi:PadR family transcriptional regulator, regulatory protein AphA
MGLTTSTWYATGPIYVLSYMLKVVSLRHAVLGFLSLRPLTGYDLKKYFDASVRHFWTADQAQIYRALSQMADEGLVQVHVIAQDSRPDRKEHHITPDGLAELDEWLRSPLEPQAIREPFLVKVFFASRLSPGDQVEMLDARIAAADRQLDALRRIGAQASATPEQGQAAIEGLLTTATLENGVRHVVTELEWLLDLRRDLDDVSVGRQQMRQRLNSISPTDQPDPPSRGDRP